MHLTIGELWTLIQALEGKRLMSHAYVPLLARLKAAHEQMIQEDDAERNTKKGTQ